MKISVIMSVYNAQDTVERAVQSILDQTHTNFEFIIINDGSTDHTPVILDKLAIDPRIHLVHQDNIGLTKSLNKGLLMAESPLIARQDADDFSLNHRFEKQVKTFTDNPDLQLLGSNAIECYDNGEVSTWGYTPKDKIRNHTLLCTPFPHSTVMMRAKTVKQLNGYDETMQTSQDMELWMRFAKIGEISMIAEPLIERTIHANAISHKRRYRQFYDALRARLKHGNRSKFYIAYFSLRSLIIGLIPPPIVSILKKL